MTLSPQRTLLGAPPETRRHVGFLLLAWTASTAVIATMVLSARRLESASMVNGAISIALLVVTTIALWVWLYPDHAHHLAGRSTTRRTSFGLTLAVVAVVLGLLGFAGTAALGVLALVALGVLLIVRGPLSRREAAVAVLFGLIAAAAGVADGWARANAAGLAFGALQLPLVVLTLLAGWRLARRTGLSAAGAGPSLAVSGGAVAAVRGFGFGLALALPWALGNVVMGTPESDDMRTVWQPLAAALQPGVAEEAWARAFLIPALFLVFALTARPRTALVTAVIISTYWFAFLHAPTDPLFTLGVGTLYGLPMALLWLRRGLETAIGFHVGLDLIRYVGSYLAAEGLWFT